MALLTLFSRMFPSPPISLPRPADPLRLRAGTTSSRKPSCSHTAGSVALPTLCLLSSQPWGHHLSLMACIHRAPLPCAPCAALWGGSPELPFPSPPRLSSSSPGRGAQGLPCTAEWTGMGVMLGRGVAWAGAQADGDPDKDLFKRGHGSCADNVLIQEPGQQRNQMSGVP